MGKSLSLKLTVPTPEEVEDPRTLLDVDVLRERVEQLALAAPRRAAKQMLEGLCRLNRHPVEPLHHEELADLYRQAFHALLDSYCGSVPAEGQVTRKSEGFLEAMRQLAAELGFAYKHVILRRYTGKRRGAGRSALLRALEMLSYQLSFLYEQHARDNPVLWKEIFQIYRLAEREGVQDQSIKTVGVPAEGDDGITIDMRLAQILLIRLLDPWRLTSSELWMARRFLESAAILVRIQSCDAPRVTGPCFLFSLGQAQLPRALQHLRVDERAAGCRLIATGRLNQYVRQELDKLSAAGGGLVADSRQRLYRLMHQAWSDLPERRKPRKPARGWVMAAWGLDAVTYFLAGEASNDELELESEVELTEAVGFGCRAPRNFSLQRCRLIDASSLGLRLEAPGDVEVAPKAGDLLLLHDKDKDTARLGYVCWLQRHGAQMVRVGVSLLFGRFRAVRVKPVSLGRGMPGYLPALLVESQKKDAVGFGLLLGRGAYQGASEFLVEDGVRLYRIASRELLDRTAAFDYLDAVAL